MSIRCTALTRSSASRSAHLRLSIGLVSLHMTFSKGFKKTLETGRPAERDVQLDLKTSAASWLNCSSKPFPAAESGLHDHPTTVVRRDCFAASCGEDLQIVLGRNSPQHWAFHEVKCECLGVWRRSGKVLPRAAEASLLPVSDRSRLTARKHSRREEIRSASASALVGPNRSPAHAQA